MGDNHKRVNLDGKPVEIREGETAESLLRRTGLGGRTLTHVEGDRELPVDDLREVPEGAILGTVAHSELG